MPETIGTVHGSGGAATGKLIQEIFAEAFGYDRNKPLEDAAVLDAQSGWIALTTDSFVVTPVIYRGGDIGRLSVCGTVNDLLSRGAVPAYLTAGFILEEGLSVETLKKVVRSMAETAEEAGVRIVTGDTKVVESRGAEEAGLFINTAGVGLIPDGRVYSAADSGPGDAIIVSGTMGDHHAAILSERLSIDTDIQSDNAPLCGIVEALAKARIRIRTIRDVTRGGLATVLKELAEASKQAFVIEEEAIPVASKVRDFCGLLGLDPLYMGNEGKIAVIVDPEDADEAVRIIRSCRYGLEASRIGSVITADEGLDGAPGVKLAPGDLIMKTPIGGLRSLSVLMGEGLPRIC